MNRPAPFETMQDLMPWLEGRGAEELRGWLREALEENSRLKPAGRRSRTAWRWPGGTSQEGVAGGLSRSMDLEARTFTAAASHSQ